MVPFDLILVPFPFSDLKIVKKRPALVLSTFNPKSLGEHLIIAQVTSKIEKPNFPFDVLIEDHKKVGLPLPSIIRLSKIVTIEQKLVLKILGRISKNDIHNVKKEFFSLFGFYNA